MMELPENYQLTLQQYWGFGSLKEQQIKAILAIHNKQDCLAVLPTGYGKSLCYQLPAIVLGGVTLVISPLVALMHDQAAQLSEKEINVINFSGNHTEERLAEMCDNVVKGWAKIVFISPERLFSSVLQDWLYKFPVSLIAIDEAHCISEWGHDFRPKYRELNKIRNAFSQVPVIALTATATLKVKQDIIKILGIKGPMVTASVRRNELSLNCSDEPEKFLMLAESLKRIKGQAIVYQPNRILTKSQALKLKEFKISALWYHGGMSAKEKQRNMLAWQSNKVRVMQATKAFGMGVDKADVRLVAHYFPPASIEEYVQEVGRAGRDGQRSYGLILYNEYDYDRIYKLIGHRNPTPEFIRKVYQALANYFELPENEGKDSSHHLDLDLFSLQNDWRINEAYYALKRIEEAGYIKLEDGIHHPAQLRWIRDADSLLAKIKELPLNKEIMPALMHGLGSESFLGFANIPIGFVAQKSGVKPRSLDVFFRKLQAAGLALYKPAKGATEVKYLTDRYRGSLLPLPVKLLEQARNTAQKKIEEVQHFIQEERICRQVMIQDYFQEPAGADCGICDNCRNKLPERQESYILKELVPVMLSFISSSEQRLSQEILTQFRFKYRHRFIISALSKLIDNGSVEMVSPGIYVAVG